MLVPLGKTPRVIWAFETGRISVVEDRALAILEPVFVKLCPSGMHSLPRQIGRLNENPALR